MQFGRTSAVVFADIDFSFRRPTTMVSVGSSYIFSAFLTIFFSWNSRWIVRWATLNYHQTIGRFYIGRQLDIWIFCPATPIDDQKSSKGRLLFGGSFWLIGWWTTDCITIPLHIYRPSVSGGLADDAMLQTFCDRLRSIKVVFIWGIRYILPFAHALRLALLYLLCSGSFM